MDNLHEVREISPLPWIEADQPAVPSQPKEEVDVSPVAQVNGDQPAASSQPKEEVEVSSVAQIDGDDLQALLPQRKEEHIPVTASGETETCEISVPSQCHRRSLPTESLLRTRASCDSDSSSLDAIPIRRVSSISRAPVRIARDDSSDGGGFASGEDEAEFILGSCPTMATDRFLERGQMPCKVPRRRSSLKERPQTCEAPFSASASSSNATPSSTNPAPPSSTSPAEDSERWFEQTIERFEYQALEVGPFEDGVIVEIISATYGNKDVTDDIRGLYSPKDGLQIPARSFNAVFKCDPQKHWMKKIVVKYRRKETVKKTDISYARWVEGIERVTLVPSLLSKVVTNAVGASFAAAGFLAGAAETSAKNFIGSEATVADSNVFQAGFTFWLRANGIFPSVTYEPLHGAYAQRDPENMKMTPFIVSNHVSYLDGPILASCFEAPKIIAKKGTLNTPLFGKFAKEIGVIEVDRDCKASRKATMEAIQNHWREWKDGDRSLLLFPEGTTSNGETLLPFKAGAFVCGEPVRPCVLTYTGDWSPANTSYKVTSAGEVEQTGDAEWVGQFFGHFIHSLKIRVLPPYKPSDEEKADPQLFADNVRALMVKANNELLLETAKPAQSWRDAVSLESLQSTAGNLMTSISSKMSLASEQKAPTNETRRSRVPVQRGSLHKYDKSARKCDVARSSAR